MTHAGPRLRLTELLASLSLATDLGTGQPLGHGLRTCLLAGKLARLVGVSGDELRSAHQVALLRFLGCTADSADVAAMAGGDDLHFNREMAPALNGGAVDAFSSLAKSVAPGRPAGRRLQMTVAIVAKRGGVSEGLSAHCEVAATLAQRLGLGEQVRSALLQAYERWDGKGYPSGIAGKEVPLEIRIATVARDVDLFRDRGMDVPGLLAKRKGRAYDPEVVDAFFDLGSDWDVPAEWDAVLDAEPEPFQWVSDLDAGLKALADFADLKSPWLRGHSTEVSGLARMAAEEAGLSSEEVERVALAGLVHDLGRVGVENGVWDKPAPLVTDEWERVSMHPYLTHRVLSRCEALAGLADLAGSHHERIDGSGYHRELHASHLTTEAQILGAADSLSAMTSARPHRPALDLDTATGELRAEATDGKFSPRAVEAVIAAAGGRARRIGMSHPAGLTDREVDVLRLISRGLTNREVGQELFISNKTVGRHVENIYSKIGVSTRAGAALFAMEQRLLQ